MTKIDFQELFDFSVCSFEVAKKAAAAGMTCANTFFAYNEKGEVGDSGWLQKIYDKAKFYPVINTPLAIFMLEDTTIDLGDESFGLFNNTETKTFVLKYKGDEISDANLVNVLVLAWIKYKH